MTTDSLFVRLGRDFRAGDVLFREGERGEEMFVIQSGLVQVLKQVGHDERALATLGRGEFLGEMAILNGKPRNAAAVVLEDARCLVIDARHARVDGAEEPRDRDAPHQEARAAARRRRRDDSGFDEPRSEGARHARLEAPRRSVRRADPRAEGGGIRINASAVDIAREVGSDVANVLDVLQRLKRLRIAWEDEVGSIVVTDVDRLMDFMEFLEMPRKFEGP